MSEWMPIETITPVERCLLWVADAGDDRKGTWAFGRCFQGERTGDQYVRAEGFSGDWKITHWMPLPPPPETDEFVTVPRLEEYYR